MAEANPSVTSPMSSQDPSALAEPTANVTQRAERLLDELGQLGESDIVATSPIPSLAQTSDWQAAEVDDAPAAQSIAQPPAAPDATGGQVEEAGDIDQYMADLLNRYGAAGSYQPASEAPVAAPATPKPAEQPAQPEKPRVRPKPAESRNDLIAMRELANSSARNAIEKHGSRQMVGAASRMMYGSAGCAIASIVMTLLAPGPQSWLFAGGAIGMILAIGCGCFFVRRVSLLGAASAPPAEILGAAEYAAPLIDTGDSTAAN